MTGRSAMTVPTIFGRPIVHVGYSVDSIEQAVEFFDGKPEE